MAKVIAGDHVEFFARGRRVTGTVARVRVKRRGGRFRELTYMFHDNPESVLNVEVAEVAEDGKRAFWTVPTVDLQVIGKSDAHIAAGAVQDVKASRQQHRQAKKQRNAEAIYNSGLSRLQNGDEIEVQFRDIGWAKAEFAGFVQGSGNVRYYRHGRKRTVSPKFVRVPKS